MTTTEYACPFCYEWVLKTNFKPHQEAHYKTDLNGMKKPETLEELKERFSAIGLYEER